MASEAVLTRYRERRSILTELQTAAMNSVPATAMLDYAKRIGLVQAGVLRPGSRAEMTLVFDLAVHTAPPGRSRAIDRIAKQRKLPAEGEEAAIMRALTDASFTFWRVDGPHEAAGIMAHDLAHRRSFWLMDEWLAKSAKPGDRFVARLANLGDYWISCGAIVPIDDVVLQLAAADTRNFQGADSDAIRSDRRFAEAFYRAAVTGGTMRAVAFREPGEV
jgi:hypothetical protein